MDLMLSPLEDSRVEEAFGVLKQVGNWLESHGRRQRIANISFESYAKWQSEHANFVVTQANEIIGLVTLRSEHLDDWPDWSGLGPVFMLRALATHPAHQGRGVAAFAIRESIKVLKTRKAIFLDCVSDSLPEYYAKFGFARVGQQVKVYPDGEVYDITLMQLVTTPIG
jgi:predicted N-acetyltransferase YhbS